MNRLAAWEIGSGSLDIRQKGIRVNVICRKHVRHNSSRRWVRSRNCRYWHGRHCWQGKCSKWRLETKYRTCIPETIVLMLDRDSRLRSPRHLRIVLTRKYSHYHLLSLCQGDIFFHSPLSELLGDVLASLLCDLSVHCYDIPTSVIGR